MRKEVGDSGATAVRPNLGRLQKGGVSLKYGGEER